MCYNDVEHHTNTGAAAMEDSKEARATMNIRRPPNKYIPPNGMIMRTPDGHQAWVAGASRVPGKLTLVIRIDGSNTADDVLPADLTGFITPSGNVL